MAAEGATLNVRAELSQLREQLARIPGMTAEEARKMTRALEGEIEKQRKAAQAAAKAAQAANQRAAKGTAGAWADAGDQIKGAFQLGALLKVAETFAGLKDKIADSRLEVANFSARSGLTIETLAGIRLAAESTGQSFDQMTDAVENLPERMMQAAQGGNETAAAFKALGVAVTDSQGKIRKEDDVLRDMIDQLAKIEDPGQKAAITMSILGDSGTRLLSILGSSKELDNFSAQALHFGTISGPEAVSSAVAWKQATASLQSAVSGMTASLVDSVDTTQKLRAATLGLVYVWNVANESVKTATSSGYHWDTIMERAEAHTRDFYEGEKKVAEGAQETAAALTDQSKTGEKGAQVMARQGQAAIKAAAAQKALAEATKRATAAEALRDSIATSGEGRLTAEQKITKELEEQLKKIREQGAIAKDTGLQGQAEAAARMAAEEKLELLKVENRIAEGERERELAAIRQEGAEAELAFAQEIDAQMRAIDEKNAAYKEAQREKNAKDAKAAGVELVQIAGDVAGQIAGLEVARRGEAISRLENARKNAIENENFAHAKALSQRIDAERKAGRVAFAAQKAAGIAAVGINTAVAIMKALAELGPIAGAFATAGIVAAGVGQIAAIAAQPPPYHVGGKIRGEQPGEVRINALEGEHMVRKGPAERYRPELDELNRTGKWPGAGAPSGGGFQLRISQRDARGLVLEATRNDSAIGSPIGRKKPGMSGGYPPRGI